MSFSQSWIGGARLLPSRTLNRGQRGGDSTSARSAERRPTEDSKGARVPLMTWHFALFRVWRVTAYASDA